MKRLVTVSVKGLDHVGHNIMTQSNDWMYGWYDARIKQPNA